MGFGVDRVGIINGLLEIVGGETIVFFVKVNFAERKISMVVIGFEFNGLLVVKNSIVDKLGGF